MNKDSLFNGACHENVQLGSYLAEILRFELKTWFSKSAKIGQKQSINFDELIKLTFAFLLFLSSFISFKSVGTKEMTVLHSFLAYFTFPEIESILLNCLPRPRVGVLHVPPVISSFDKRDN